MAVISPGCSLLSHKIKATVAINIWIPDACLRYLKARWDEHNLMENHRERYWMGDVCWTWERIFRWTATDNSYYLGKSKIKWEKISQKPQRGSMPRPELEPKIIPRSPDPKVNATVEDETLRKEKLGICSFGSVTIRRQSFVLHYKELLFCHISFPSTLSIIFFPWVAVFILNQNTFFCYFIFNARLLILLMIVKYHFNTIM